MKSFTSKERKELLKRWNESNNRRRSSTTLLRDNRNGKEDESSNRRDDDDERNGGAPGRPSMMKRRDEGNVVGEKSAGAVESSFEKTDFARRAQTSNAARDLNDKNNTTRHFNEECEENVDGKRSGGRQKRKLGWMCDGEDDARKGGERGTKESSSEKRKERREEEEEELWRKQSRSVWLMRTSVSSSYSSSLRDEKSACVDKNTADAAAFDDVPDLKRDPRREDVAARRDVAGGEEEVCDDDDDDDATTAATTTNEITEEQRRRVENSRRAATSSKSSSSKKEDKYLLYTQAMERLASKMKTENEQQAHQSRLTEEARAKEHAMALKSLEKEQMCRSKLEKDLSLLKQKKVAMTKERDWFSRRVEAQEREREKLLRDIAQTKSKSSALLKEQKFTIEAQGEMLEQLRRELETSEKMALECEKKCEKMSTERRAAEERLADAKAQLKAMQEQSTDKEQNARAISIAHEKVFSLAKELKDKDEKVAKMEEKNTKLQREVDARKRELAEIQKQLESDVESERSLRVDAEKKMRELMKEMKSIEEEKEKRVEELRALEKALQGAFEERDALKETVREREIEILKHLKMLEEKEKIENETIEKYSQLQEEIELRDLKAMESYNNNNNNEVQRKAAEIDRKEQQNSSSKLSSNNHSKMLAIERQKVTEAMKAKRYLERQLLDEKKKLQEKEKMLKALEEKYASAAKRVVSDDTKAEEEMKVLTEKVSEMTKEIREKDERLQANEELLSRMHSEKKKRDGELERMRVSLTEKDEVVKKLEDDLKSEVQKSRNNIISNSSNNDGGINTQQHVFMMKQKDAMIQSAQSKVAALEEKAKQSSATEESLRKELEQLQKFERTAKAEREHLERQLKMAEEKEKKLSAHVDAMSADREKSSSNAAELFEANRRCLDLRAKCDAKDKELEETRVKLKEMKEMYENEQKMHLATQEYCAIYVEDLVEAAVEAQETIIEHQTTIETNREEMERLQTNLTNAEKKCELASSEAQALKASLENTQTVLHARVEEIERLRSQSTSEKENMSSKLMFLEDETASLNSKLQEKQAKLNKALGDISKYQRESEQSKRQLDAFRASKEVTEERLREEQDKLHKSEQNCEQLSDMLRKNVERHANVLSANERMKNMEIEDLKETLRALEKKAKKIAEVVHIDKAFFDGLDVEAQLIVEAFCEKSENMSSPTPSKMMMKADGVKTPMTAPSANRGHFVSAPSSPADRFQTPKTSMQTTSRLGRTTIATAAKTASKSAGKPVTFSSAGKHHHKSHVSQRLWGMVSEASKINVDLQGLAETAKKRLQEHQESLSAKKSNKTTNNSAVKALRLDVNGGEDSGQKPKPAGTPSKLRVLQPVPFNVQ